MKYGPWYFFMLCMPMFSSAQLVGESRGLKEVLLDIERSTEVRFSYVDQLVEGKEVEYDPTLSVDELIQNLERSTRLRFEKVRDDYIIVRHYRDDDLVSLCGYIANYKSEPLLGISIGYSQTEGVFTDQDGFFKLDSIPFGSWLTLRYVGYATKKLKVSRLDFKQCLRVRMSESVKELEEIVISDYLTAGISKSKNNIRIDPQTLKMLSGLAEPDILQSIQQVPGVNSPFETATGIHVRGGLPDQNLILWNGIKTYSQGHFFGMISAFNPYASDKVNFIKHGTSAKYGDRVSSVIEISSQKEIPKSVTGSVGTNMLYSDGYIHIPVISDRLSIQVSGRRSFTDFIETPTFKQLSDRVFQNTKIEDASTTENQVENKFYFTDFSFNSIWKIDNHNDLNISTLYNENSLDFESQNIIETQSFTDLLINANEGYNITWNRKLSEGLNFSVSGNYSRYILQYDFLRTVSDTTTQSSKKNLVREGGLQLNGTYRINDRSSLNAGYHFNDLNIRYAYETITSSYEIVLDSDNSTIISHSGYVDYLYEGKDIIIRPGVRYNYYDQLDQFFFEPRLFVQFKPVEPISLFASGEYRTQVASQIKESVVSDLSLENKVWALASPDRFPVIKSFQLAFGANYSKEGWFAEAEFYLKQVEGITTLIFGYLNGLENDFREGDSDIHGIDLLVKKVWPSYESWISYSYIRTQNSFSGINDNQKFPGSWSIEHTARWSNIVNVRNWEFSLGLLWHTGKSFTDVTTQDGLEGPIQIAYENINARNLPIYHRMDFSAMREFKSQKHSNHRYRLGISILNIYNRRNLLNREFRTTPSLENELIDTRVYSLGITPNLVFRFFF